MKRSRTCLVPLAVLLALLCAGIAFSNLFAARRLTVAAVALGASAVMLLICRLVELRWAAQQKSRNDAVFSENAEIASRLVDQLSIPCALVERSGAIVWRNESMKKIYNESDVCRVMPSFDFTTPLVAVAVEYAGSTYQVMSVPVRRAADERDLLFQYWLDRTEAAHYQRLFEEQMPYVALIYIDNYEELSADVQFHRASVFSEVERLISDMVKGMDGIYRRYENGRYFVVFEAQHLAGIEKDRFSLLEQAHAIDTGTSMTVSLSIAVGASDRVAQADESARQAMELALGRGGDQAVIKKGGGYVFYGGRRQPEAMQSRVKMRLFSKALRQLFENTGDVFIAGHSRPDMDCIGAALGVATCAKQVGSRAYIVIDEQNVMIEHALELIRQNGAYGGMLITPEHAEKIMRPSSVLVVVDTQRVSSLVAPKLLEMASRVVVIDHHRRGADHIDNPTLHFLEARASSTSELVTEMLQYFDANLRPPAFVCGTLLAGITIDTKHFAFNVGSRTFDAAGYLRRNGADIAMVKQMFQDDMESFGDVANTVRSADVLPGGVAIAAVGEDVKNAPLIAAKAADELIGIRGIEAAFVLGREDGGVNVSGRSLGKVNVQLICEKLGGGGQLTMAGAQMKEMELDEAEAHVRNFVEQYLQEVEKQDESTSRTGR
ncbi:MAG: DHH family phosphoesterase [Eubacteriales bacterium]|nr:DHH family phosphoesterase [Eubacteriales bacterium]